MFHSSTIRIKNQHRKYLKWKIVITLLIHILIDELWLQAELEDNVNVEDKNGDIQESIW